MVLPNTDGKYATRWLKFQLEEHVLPGASVAMLKFILISVAGCWARPGTKLERSPAIAVTGITSGTSKCISKWEQCGGTNYDGPTCCEAGLVCVVENEWYSQCVPSESTTTTSAIESTSTASSTSKGSGECAGAWHRCGGRDHKGPTCCTPGYFCKAKNECYSQCTPVGSRQRFLGLIQSASKLARSEEL
eukprot:Skav228294  [mRNA]  locus=scaffold209:186591:187160:- [translate_table: standard]